MRTIATLLALAGLLQPVERPAPTRIQIADGIYLFRTAPYGEAGLDGNSIAIVSNDGVLVFDTNGTPSAAEAVLAEIRAITTQPVRFLVYSHWHWDHWYGTEVYTRAFPGVQVIAHENTRAMMAGPAIEFNRPGLETQLPAYIKFLEDQLAAGKAKPESLANAKFFLDQKRQAAHILPTVTYSTGLTLHMGDREIRVMNHGRAVTPGDTFLYLPREKVLITGDLLINPVTYALSCYPTEWIRTLEFLDTLDASVIVPGHGEPLGDKTLLHATTSVLRDLWKLGTEAKARGLDPDQAKDEIFPKLHDQMVVITKDVPAVNSAFKAQLVDWYLHRVYDELNGPMTNAIAPIPPK